MAGFAGTRHSSAFLNFQCRRTPAFVDKTPAAEQDFTDMEGSVDAEEAGEMA